MNNYIQIEFQNISQEESDLVVAQLSEIGFEGFEEEENRLKAFIPSNDFDEILLGNITEALQIYFSKTIIEETNWNQVWESNFEPVIVDDYVAIRADFHKPITNTQFEIVITPKMSFGTGHHATTYMTIELMKEIDFNGRSALDFGTGTGILAILAERSGAKTIVAIDNDDWSIANAEENIKKNNCNKIILRKAADATTEMKFDIILANINKNVILENLVLLTEQLNKGGQILLSGLLEDDKDEILSIATELNLKLKKELIRNNWIALQFHN